MQVRNRESGQSLIQVMIGVAIMGITITGMSTLFGNLNRESQSVAEKLAALDLEKILINALADGSVCKYIAQSTSLPPFCSNSAMSESTPVSIVLPNTLSPAALYASYVPASGPTPAKLGPAVAQVGQSFVPDGAGNGGGMGNGGAGGGGGAAMANCAVTAGNVLTVTVGAGGAAGTYCAGCAAFDSGSPGAVVLQW